MKKSNRKLMVLTLFNTVVLGVLYFALAAVGFLYTHYLYVGAAAVLAVSFVVYNRGFSGWNVTVEMLPREMPAEEKVAFLNDSKRRKQKSKWILTLLFPLLITLTADLFYLFCLPSLEEWADKLL